jgi:hypothetical protein
MAEEIDVGVAYLTALKKLSTDEAAATAAAEPAQDTTEANMSAIPLTPVSEGRFHGSDKRRTPRYKCEGSVELIEEGCSVRTWAMFTDINQYGCYIEAQATYPVGTNLYLKMTLNGKRVEGKGIVRVNYPYLGMGIAFVEMSEENRERLNILLNPVTYPRVIAGPGATSIIPTRSLLDAAPAITNPDAVMQALAEFFQIEHILTREHFLKIVAQSQDSEIER